MVDKAVLEDLRAVTTISSSKPSFLATR